MTQGNLWAMNRTTFRRIILKTAFKKRKMYETLLETVPILRTLTVSLGSFAYRLASFACRSRHRPPGRRGVFPKRPVGFDIEVDLQKKNPFSFA